MCRKTGITLEERARDEHGIEAISGIFSSPEKSPPKRGSTMTGSESMDIQESACDLPTILAHTQWLSWWICANLPTHRLHSKHYHVRCYPAQQSHSPSSTSLAIADEDCHWVFAAPPIVHGASRQFGWRLEPYSRNVKSSCSKATRFPRGD